MRIFFLGNNWVGWQVIEWLTKKDEQIVGLVTHPPEKQKYGEKIIESSQLSHENIFDGSKLDRSKTLRAIKALRPDIGLSVFFGYILKLEFLNLFPSGVINLHPALLPYNKGAFPNAWSIIESTPAGVTIHYIDEGIDTGDIIAQREVSVEPIDTGYSLYLKLEKTAVKLFQDTWPLIRNHKAESQKQDSRVGTYHRTEDTDRVDWIDLEKHYLAKDLINTIRARTFPPYQGAYFIEQGRKVYLQLHLYYEKETKKEKNG